MASPVVASLHQLGSQVVRFDLQVVPFDLPPVPFDLLPVPFDLLVVQFNLPPLPFDLPPVPFNLPPPSGLPVVQDRGQLCKFLHKLRKLCANCANSCTTILVNPRYP